MCIKRKYEISELSFPVDGYKWDAKVWLSVDGGDNYYYCGIGKYCKTKEEAEAYCADYEAVHGEGK